MFVVIAGNVVDGLTFFGPFENQEEANQYAEDQLRKEDWVVALLNRPSMIVYEEDVGSDEDS